MDESEQELLGQIRAEAIALDDATVRAFPWAEHLPHSERLLMASDLARAEGPQAELVLDQWRNTAAVWGDASLLRQLNEDSSDRTVWVVIPTYNEAENIAAIARAVLEQLTAGDRLLIVDDNSPDGTGQIADRLAADDPRIEVLHRPGKEGLGPAYLAGFARALTGGAGLIVQMDADFSHDPEQIPELVRAATRGDLVIGSRYRPGGQVAGWPWYRRALSQGGSFYAQVFLRTGIRDITGGFKCFRREVLEALDLREIRSSGYCFQIEMNYRAARAGFRIREIPITFRERSAGSSKMSPAIVREAVLGVPRLRFFS